MTAPLPARIDLLTEDQAEAALAVVAAGLPDAVITAGRFAGPKGVLRDLAGCAHCGAGSRWVLLVARAAEQR